MIQNLHRHPPTGIAVFVPGTEGTCVQNSIKITPRV